MESGSDNSELLQRLLAEPDQYEQIALHFEDNADCFESLRGTAKTSLESFDEFAEFYTSYIEGGAVSVVQNHLDRNATRELKNMILRDSKVGRQFPIFTMNEYEYRIKKYRELGDKIGVEDITPRAVTSTIIEHLVEKDRHSDHGYDIIDNLLDGSSDSLSDAISMLVQARFVFATESLRSDSDAFRRYVEALSSDLPDPYPDDNRSSKQLLRAANDIKYENPKKLKLVQSSLARQGNLDSLQEYLYLNSREIVERHRHRSHQNPWRGEIWLAIKQPNCLRNPVYNLTTEQEAYINSYQRVALGVNESTGGWRSQRDPEDLPNPDFLKASKHFLHAARYIQSIDKNRYIKYLSKSFRHLANATPYEFGFAQGWIMSQQVHGTAIDVISEMLTDDTEDDLAQTITETIALHKFKEHEARAVVAFERGKPDNIIEQTDAAWGLIDGEVLPVFVETDVLETAKELAEALRLEERELIDEAIEQYKDTSNLKFNVRKRKNITEIKRELINGNHESSIELIDDMVKNTHKLQS